MLKSNNGVPKGSPRRLGNLSRERNMAAGRTIQGTKYESRLKKLKRRITQKLDPKNLAVDGLKREIDSCDNSEKPIVDL